MTDAERLLPLISLLSLAYPEKRLSPETLQLYLELLSDIPDYVLEAAVRAHIQASPYFPRLSELRTLAQRLTGGRQFAAMPPTACDRLAAAAQALEDAFYQSGELDLAAWETLAAAFDKADRPFRAAHTREKLRRLRAISQWTAGDDVPEERNIPERESVGPAGVRAACESETEKDGNISISRRSQVNDKLPTPSGLRNPWDIGQAK